MSSYGEPREFGITGTANFPANDVTIHTPQGYAEGYRAGRIAALREVGCLTQHWRIPPDTHELKTCIEVMEIIPSNLWCRRCRLLAEAQEGPPGEAQ